jgi:hypothetical protein
MSLCASAISVLAGKFSDSFFFVVVDDARLSSAPAVCTLLLRRLQQLGCFVGNAT